MSSPAARAKPPLRRTDDVARLERLYGEATEMVLDVGMHPWEFELLRRSKTDGRYRDATILIPYENKLVCIVKHEYPTGIARPPSGGVCPGEGLDATAEREAWEETGLRVRVQRYLARVVCSFTLNPDARPLANPLAEASHKRWDLPEEPRATADAPEYWESHVFWATPTGGRLGTRDAREIKDVVLVEPEDLMGPIHEAMKSSGIGGFRYRVIVQEASLKRAESLGLLPSFA